MFSAALSIALVALTFSATVFFRPFFSTVFFPIAEFGAESFLLALVFVLVARRVGSDDLWLAPKLQLFWDFYGLVDSALSGAWKEFDPVVDWANKWGAVGLMGLHSHNLQLLEEFRVVLTTKILQGYEFSSFPKEALTRSPNYTLILKSNMRTFDLTQLTSTLLDKNRETLVGSLYPTQIKYFSNKNVTRQGESKAGWRMVVFKADSTMIKSLRKLEDDYVFKLTAGGIQLRGGERRRRPSP